MTIESSRQLLTAKDRIAARAERAFKESVSTPLSDQFSVVVFTDYNNPTGNPSMENDKQIEGYHFCRVRSLEGHHDMLENPVVITNREHREIAINSCPQAYVPLDGLVIQTGDVWSATREGDIIRLNTLIERERFKLKDSSGKEVSNSFKDGTPKLNGEASSTPVEFVPSKASTPEDAALFDLIAKKESRGSYNAANTIWYPSGKGGGAFKLSSDFDAKFEGKSLTELTFAEVKKAQQTYFRTRYPKNKPRNSYFAMGKFQVIPATMRTVIAGLRLSDDDLYNQENQDKIIEYLIYAGQKRPKLSQYLLGSNSVTLDEAQIDLAREFSSMPKPNGNSYYGNEKAGHDPQAVRKILENARNANIKNGRTK
jgi:hypothetical protein